MMALLRRGLRRSAGDGGFTLVEVLVGMVLMTTVGAMFTTAVLTIYRTTARAEAIAESQSRVTLAVNRLDREIRYASAISRPATAGGNRYVEFLVTNNRSDGTCVQLRVEPSGTNPVRYAMKRREWTQGQITTATPWTLLMTDLTTLDVFHVPAADPAVDFQRLRLRLTAQVGVGTVAKSKETDITFTALNSSMVPDNSAICAEGR